MARLRVQPKDAQFQRPSADGGGRAHRRSHPRFLNSNFNNGAPIFYSALQQITPPRWAEAYDKKVTAMNDRFTVRVWSTPLLHHRRVPDFPHCAPCFASFMLDNDAAWQNEFA